MFVCSLEMYNDHNLIVVSISIWDVQCTMFICLSALLNSFMMGLYSPEIKSTAIFPGCGHHICSIDIGWTSMKKHLLWFWNTCSAEESKCGPQFRSSKLVKMYSYVNSVLFDSSAFSLWLVLVQILHSIYPTHNFILSKSIFNLLNLFFQF